MIKITTLEQLLDEDILHVGPIGWGAVKCNVIVLSSLYDDPELEYSLFTATTQKLRLFRPVYLLKASYLTV